MFWARNSLVRWTEVEMRWAERLQLGGLLGPTSGPREYTGSCPKTKRGAQRASRDWRGEGGRRKRRRMVGGRGGGRRQERQALVVAFAVALLMGTAVYFRIWARQSDDPSFTADDREELRRQFEHANLEAMDESAEWRMKYDTEFGKNRQLQDELVKVKASLSASTRRFDSLQKDNEMLKKQIESMKLQCNCTVPVKITRK